MDVKAQADVIPQFGLFELTLTTSLAFSNPYVDVNLEVVFLRPDGSQVRADGFYDGGDVFRARAYASQCGRWTWRSRSELGDLDGLEGAFIVEPSELPGKLRVHGNDPYQFAYDNGEWFLHLGDTGYRYLAGSELKWRAYLDQAAAAGFTKIRTWFSLGRSHVKDLLEFDRQRLNLAYWQEMDRRVAYAWSQYPKLQLQLIPFGEDMDELLRYGDGDAASRGLVRYAVARFSAYPNVQWCLSNDLRLESACLGGPERNGQEKEIEQADRIKGSIRKLGADFATLEPWGTLLTNHQSRFSGYSFTDCSWSDIVTLEDLGQVNGELILRYRERAARPVVMEEDRYESWRAPQHPRYYFRRLMWSSLLSGGHATYGGLRTWDAYDGGMGGMQGYYDACAGGKLASGAHDFVTIHRFFRESGLTLAGMVPDDGAVGGDPLRWKAIRDRQSRVWILYLANPNLYEGHAPEGFGGVYTDETAAPRSEPAAVRLPEEAAGSQLTWFHPVTGEWTDGGTYTLAASAPFGGDAVLLLRTNV